MIERLENAFEVNPDDELGLVDGHEAVADPLGEESGPSREEEVLPLLDEEDAGFPVPGGPKLSSEGLDEE